MIELLGDSSVLVQQASRRSLILLACQATGPQKPCAQLTRQVKSLLKFGPEPTAKKKLVTKAAEKWNAWWDENDPDLSKLLGANQSPGEKPHSTAVELATPAAPEPVDPEKASLAKLKLAKMLAKDGLEKKARARYEEIVKEYPKTKAAEEARKLLDDNKQKSGASEGDRK